MMAEAEGRRDPNIMYVGVDLGTYRTSITASNGLRKTVISVVGWPKDDISRKLLGKDMVFGHEALRHRLALNLVRPLEKGVIKYSDDSMPVSNEELQIYKGAAKEMVKHAISLAQPQNGQTVYAVIGAPAQASVINKQSIIEAAVESPNRFPWLTGWICWTTP